MLIFAAETSCDETSICLMENKEIVKHTIFSQEIHSKFGGVIPELASRSHLQILQQITHDIFHDTLINPKNIDIFTATCGPGLAGCLLVGSTFVKSLAIGYKKPFVPMNHLEGHLLSTSFNNNIDYPQIVMLLTGGHTQIYLMKNETSVELIGESVDDALGEAFDKVAKLIGLPYPGGAELEKKAKLGDENFFELPKPMTKEKNLNFSFSGIKTHISLMIKKNEINNEFICNLSASFQKNISEILNLKLFLAIENMKNKGIKIKSVSVVGGVANNKYIKKKLENSAKKNKIKIFFPIKEMISDNAAMIAWACIKNYNKNKENLYFDIDPRLEIEKKLI